MPQRPGVSVVIPTYNRATLVSEAVASALGQDWDPLEVIVIDDASSDDTVERLSRLTSGETRLRVIARERNGGESVARNQGILAATHEYVAFLDSDNRFMPDKLAHQMPALLSSFPGAVSFSGYLLSEDERECEVLLDHWASESTAVIHALLKSCAVNTSTFIAPRAMLVDHGLFRTDLACCEDHDLWLRLAALGHPFVYTREALTLYRMHDGSVSGDAARVAKYEEVVIHDFLARPNLSQAVIDRSGEVRAHWAFTGAERFIDADMPIAALRALGRAAITRPRAIRAGWLRLALQALWMSLVAQRRRAESGSDA